MERASTAAGGFGAGRAVCAASQPATGKRFGILIPSVDSQFDPYMHPDYGLIFGIDRGTRLPVDQEEGEARTKGRGEIPDGKNR